MALHRLTVPAVKERVARLLPPPLAWQLDITQPGVLSSWGGPLNGQRERQRIVRDLARHLDFETVVETGTFRGTSTEFLASVTGAEVHTVESSPRNYEFARRRFVGRSAIHPVRGDSRSFLRQLSSSAGDAATLFYLDAHWHDDLPLRDELEIIAGAWRRAVVLVDDFQVPGDPGYGYDDYGPGKALTADYLPPLEGWQVSYPAAPSRVETGARRGCVVLASPAVADVVAQVPGLRSAGRLGTRRPC